MHGTALTAFLLSLFAGLATGLGGLVVLLPRRPNVRLLAFGLGFSAGVMVFISLVELLPHATDVLGTAFGAGTGAWISYGCFFGGIAISAGIDAVVPKAQNPHEPTLPADLDRLVAGPGGADRPNLSRTGLLTALVIALHNFPEGMATFVNALVDPALGVSVAVAVAIHNVPEGVSVALLVFFASGSRGKAIVQSFASGLAEPVGALLVYLVLMPWIDEAVVGALMAGVAGIMVFISFDELLPTARAYGQGHLEVTGIVLGMAVMAASLALA